MLISHSRPSDITWTLLGTGAAFLTSSDRLTNGRPTSGTRIQWLSGAQTTASVLTLRGIFDDFFDIGFCGLVGTTLPIGTRVVCKRRFSSPWLTPTEGVVTQRADGVRVVWFNFEPYPSNDQWDGAEFEIYNDVFGSASIAASSTFEIGEAWAGLVSEWCIRPTYESNIVDFSKQNLSINGQPFPTSRRFAETSQLEFTPVVYDDAFGPAVYDNAYNNSSIDALRNKISGLNPCVVVPITAQPFTGSPVDILYVHQHAKFGYAVSLGPIAGEAPRFVFSGQFQAPPVLLP